MKNKEAIEILNQQKYPYPEHYKDIEVNEALDLAIKVLEEKTQGECCGSCYLCDVGDCRADMRNTAKPTKEVIDKLGECKCNTCKHNGTWACNKCHCFDKYEGGAE